MKNLALASLLVAGTFLAAVPAALAPSARAAAVIEENSIVPMTSGNTVTFRTPFTPDTVDTAIKQLLEKNAELEAGAPLFLVIDSPGGSIEAGLRLITAAKGLPREVKTVNLFSASMGFMTAQHLGERLITEHGIFMSHRAQGGMEGEFDGNLESRLAFFKSLFDGMEQTAADRMGLTLPVYKQKVASELWLHGKNAVAQKAADKVVRVTCGKDLLETYVETVSTMFGKLDVTFSKCPLISAPLKIEKAKNSAATNEQMAQVFNLLSMDRQTAYNVYVRTGEYKKVFK